MKKINKIFAISAVVMTAGVALQSCVSETPFSTSGEGTLTMETSIRGDVKVTTRAEDHVSADYDEEVLKNNLVVYIENGKGIIRKYKGFSTIPSSIVLQTGSYVVEGWTGDSVSASFVKKFYRGYQPIEISEGHNTMELHCNIANVIVSVDPTILDKGISDFTVSFKHSRGELAFDENNIRDAKGYFMMPNADKDISYIIEGTAPNGNSIKKEGVIENVQRAHEYKLNVKVDPTEITQGGTLIRIEIEDIPVIDETVDVFPAPGFRVTTGSEVLDYATEQVVGTPGNFQDVNVRILAYGGLSNLTFDFKAPFSDMEAINGKNVVVDESAEQGLIDKGMRFIKDEDTWDAIAGASGADEQTKRVVTRHLVLTKAFLDALPVPVDDTQEYVLEITATDGRSHTSVGNIRIANSENAVAKPAPIESSVAPDTANDPMAVLAKSATLYGNLKTEDATEYGLMYREQGESEWTRVNAATRAKVEKSFSVQLSGLKPGTTYEYKAFCDDFEEKDTSIKTFTTESVFVIPNASMEEWSNFKDNSKVLVPSGDGIVSFWDSGNHGSATMNKLVTNKSTSMFHSGATSAELKSQFVGIGSIGKFAAGNLFVGSYDETQGTDGVLTFGRPYNGSHPTAVSIWANYRPGIVEKKAAADGYLKEGDTDKGQIYVALTTGGVKVRTKVPSQLFNPQGDKNADCEYDVIAYGQITWDAAFGEDGQLANIRIPFEYTEKAKTMAPTHLVIVCSASKFGDYFCGGEGSLLYVDDFELVYE